MDVVAIQGHGCVFQVVRPEQCEWARSARARVQLSSTSICVLTSIKNMRGFLPKPVVISHMFVCDIKCLIRVGI